MSVMVSGIVTTEAPRFERQTAILQPALKTGCKKGTTGDGARKNSGNKKTGLKPVD
ncbi:MAG: hypothetical protein ACMV1D_04180 [Macromonas sp.]